MNSETLNSILDFVADHVEFFKAFPTDVSTFSEDGEEILYNFDVYFPALSKEFPSFVSLAMAYISVTDEG